MTNAFTNSTSLIKTILHRSLAEGVYRDVVSRSSNYYYYLGKTINWVDELEPPYPVDSYEYERLSRNEIITLKEIRSSDVAFVIPRINWVSNTVYDKYDDLYSDEIIGLDIIDGGSGYTSAPTITVSGGGGFGAQFNAVLFENKIVDIETVSRGSGYTAEPTVQVTGGGSSGAVLSAVLNIAPSGAQRLEECDFYVMTDDYNVYKCLDNNNGAESTVKPIGTQVSPISTSDGYVWKYMYNIPIVLRNKFLSESFIPVTSALTNQFYSNGSIENVIITNKGSGYTGASISVVGDGYLALDPVYLQNVIIAQSGANYSSAATVAVADPVPGATLWVSGGVSVILGQKIKNSAGDFYEVVSAGTLNDVFEPTHKSGIVINGTSALKYIGTRANATATVAAGKITSINLLGGVREVTIINAGSGYTSAPKVVFSGGGGSNATGFADLRNGSVLQVNITNLGNDYTSAPTVTFGTQWVSGGHTNIGDQIYFSNRLYTVSGGDSPMRIEDSYYINKKAYVGAQDSNPGALFFSPDGLKMFVAGDSGNNVVAYNLTIAWDVSTAVFVNESGASLDTSPTGIYFSSDGTKLYIVGFSTDTVYQYNLATAWALPATLTAAETFFVGTQDTLPRGLAFSSDGTRMYITGDTNDTVYEYSLGTAWSVSSAVISSSFSVSAQASVPNDIAFSSDGKYMVITDAGSDYVYQYNLGTAWSISSASYYNSFYIGSFDALSSGVFLESSNNYLYIIGINLDTVYQFQIPKTLKLGSVSPSHSSGSDTNGDVILSYAGLPATGTTVLKYGSGYSEQPQITITDTTGSGAQAYFNLSKSEAKIIPIIENGQITGVNVLDGGVGYTTASLTVSGDGIGCTIAADLNIGNIQSLQANTELLTPAGTINCIEIVSGGYNYSQSIITIEGDGSGAIAEAVIDEFDRISKINITNPGVGYTHANVSVSGDGFGAKLRAIISPFGGHGKNSSDELFARTLMFYANVSNDLNQGLTVNNDYRQIGIIRNPRVYNGDNRFNGIIGSACFIVEATSVNNPASPLTTYFSRDQDVFVTRTINGNAVDKKYRIVSLTAKSILLQSLENDIPLVNDTFKRIENQSTVSFQISSVGNPTVDKYSGQLLFIDNKRAFTPSSDETVILRTSIKF